ncbi:MAG TPA: TetR/AcrR family transcriptional regulator [Microbacterium sp.]|nr:TetR/AcrR family transcriptional regulator [Microbacterium sp.]
MTPRAADPRTIRTVAALRAALAELVADTPVDDVTVTQLCAAAGIPRTTYYSHFGSVPELLVSTLVEAVHDVIAVNEPQADIEATASLFLDRFTDALELIRRERAMFRAAFASSRAGLLVRELDAMLARRVEIAFAIWEELGIVDGTDRRIAVPFLAGALTAVLHAWARSDDTDAAAWTAATTSEMPAWWPRPGS